MADPDPPVAEADVLALLQQTCLRALLASADQWLPLDVTLPQLQVLLLLAKHDHASPTWLAQQPRTTRQQSVMTGIIDRLVARGWVSRAKDPYAVDRRSVVIRLTPAGEALLHALSSAGVAHLRDQVDSLPPETLADLTRGLTSLLQAIEGPPSP